MKKKFRFSDYGTIFSTRPKADEIARILSQYIATLNNDGVLVIDFDGVEAMSYSFLDQFLAHITRLRLFKAKRISIARWSDSLVSVIDRSLQHRDCQYSQSDPTTRRAISPLTR